MEINKSDIIPGATFKTKIGIIEIIDIIPDYYKNISFLSDKTCVITNINFNQINKQIYKDCIDDIILFIKEKS